MNSWSLVSFAGCRACLIYMCLTVYEFSFILFIHHRIHFYFKLCTYCNILDINLLWIMNFVKYLLFYMKLLNYLFCKMFGRTGLDLWPTYPGNLIPVLGRPDTLTQPFLRAPKPGIASQPQPASQLKAWSHIACNRSATSLRPKFRVVAGRLQGGCKVVGDWSPTGCRRLQGRFGRKEVLVAASETSLRPNQS